MFWARARERYRDVSSDDEDIKKFQRLSNSFQTDIYKGIAGAIQDVGHRWVAGRTPAGRVLEIGFGAGRHSLFYTRRWDQYIASEFSQAHLNSEIWKKFQGKVIRCDARKLPFPARSFDSVISIYNLEHISDLQSVFHEVCRVLMPEGKFLVALPCEGGFLWNLGRELTSRRMFQEKYGINYDKVIAYEHVWDFAGVQSQIADSGLFNIRSRVFFPCGLPTPHLNLIACLELSPCHPG